MKRYMTQYLDNVKGWQDIEVHNTKDEAQKRMDNYLKENPWVKQTRYVTIMK